MARERKEFDRRWLWLVTAIVLVLVFFSVRSLTREHLVVRVARVESGPLASTVSTNGRVEPEDNREYASPVSSPVKAIYVQQGDKVPKGKLLIELDDLDARARLASANTAVKTAQAALEAATHNGSQEQRQASEAELARNRMDRDQAQRNLDALQKLSTSGAASQSEIAAAREQLASADASLKATQQSASGRYSPAEIARTQAALEEAEANSKAARELVANCAYRAPVTGTVYSIDTRKSEFAEAGKILLQMADLTKERVRAYFDEPEIGRLAVGQSVQIKWDARPGLTWNGHIERVPITVITYGNRTVGEVLIQIDGGDGGLLPATNVTVTATTSSESSVLSVPREALYSENGKPYVFKVINNSLVRTPVVTGSLNLTQIGILSGLKEGDVVATGTTSGQPLQIGIPIQVVQ